LKLTPKQERSVAKYLIDLNVTGGDPGRVQGEDSGSETRDLETWMKK
jgi:hypothetical protein